jgi:hypothetical protein
LPFPKLIFAFFLPNNFINRAKLKYLAFKN